MNLLRGVTIGQHYPLNSPIHHLDPRFKICFVFIYITALFTANGPFAYTVLLLFCLMVIYLSKIPFKLILRGLKPVLWIVGFTLLLHSFSTAEGEILWQWWRFTLYSGGILRGVMMSSRLILLISLTSLLTLTTSPIALTDGLEMLMKPLQRLGFPAHELAMMMTIALRFVPTLIEEADKIIKAQTARGADFEQGGLISRAKNLLPVLVPLFISAFRRADDLAIAMEARCYRGGEHRTRMKELKSGGNDWIALLILLACFTLILLLRLSGLDVWQVAGN
ncbi:MAG: energy-coupling factor transporter transmembrane protein EcfT [Negativicutes bacterium]|nr:energy-coupling factor transporter transmembrane protein EcfT [Negativicutes bacterium]